MKWFKHDSDASSDAKIKKLIIRHGAVGYAVYFHCLELITADLSESHLTFELEHDSEIIADNLKIVGNNTESGMDIVEKIMRTIIDLNLFVENDDKLFCLKLAKRIDSSMTSNPRFREKIKNSHDSIMIPSCKNRIEENRKEQKKKEVNKEQKHKYGEYNHVLLTDSEIERLKADFQNYKDMIQNLDEAIEQYGYKYKNHNLTIRKWESNKPTKKKGGMTEQDYKDMEDIF